MSVVIMCLTSTGGLPLFTRKKGDAMNLPFSTVASLNGVHMFGKSQNVNVVSTNTENAVLVWKEFQDSVILVGASHETSEDVLNQLLESIFNAMVITVGLEDIKNQRNIERLKRDLRISFPLIDRLLECIDTASSVNQIVDLIGLTEVILCPENHLLQTLLESYTESVESLFGCILVHGKVAVATKNWWNLHPEERKLLSLLISIDTQATARDMPIFLPFKSPEVAFRLVTASLIQGVEVCTICGPNPKLAEIDHAIFQNFRSSIDILVAAEKCYPSNFPQSLQIDSEVLGVLLINIEDRKFMLSRNVHKSLRKRSMSGTHKLDILRTFYYEAVVTFLLSYNQSETESPQITDETYWCSEYHKCHAIRIGYNVLCVLYTSAVQTHTMRLISQKILKELTSDKQICW